MKVNGIPTRTIWSVDHGQAIGIIDQTKLPFEFEKIILKDWRQVQEAIATMKVRGAPLIGIAGAWAMVLAVRDNPSDDFIHEVRSELISTRPTAVNLQWAVDHLVKRIISLPAKDRLPVAYREAEAMTQADVLANRAIGTHGAKIIAELYAKKREPVNILTHCNAGWLATVDYGELAGFGVPHTVIADNAGGHLMQHREVDAVIVGADRITAIGDVANKVGTYLKALAAKDMEVPFYVAAPSSTIDWSIQDGKHGIKIENRSGDELRYIRGRDKKGHVCDVRVMSEQTNVENPAFDVTPAKLVTGIITERGVCAPEFLTRLFPEGARAHARG